MQLLQPTIPNPLNQRVSLNNLRSDAKYGSELTPKLVSKTLRQSITITNGYFCNNIMRKIEHRNNLNLRKISMKKARIGRGTSAVVHLALYNEHHIALKEYKLNDSQFCEFYNELNILNQLNSVYIIQFFGFHLNVHKKVCKLAFEYCPNGSLFDIIHPLFEAQMYEYEYKHILNMLLDIAQGMKYIHSRNIINRDLKSRNLLVFDDYHIKITDFGESVLIDYDCNDFVDYKLYDDVGTNGYKAPEIVRIDADKGYDYKIDIFSFGSICYELYTKEFVSGIRYLTRYDLLKSNLHLKIIPDECDDGFYCLIALCWNFDPEKRPTFDAIIDILNECVFGAIDHGDIQCDRNMDIQ